MRQNRLIGRRVAGRFTIKRFLGEGGMATVFVAEQEGEPREVALKIMNEELTSDRTFVKRFQREAKAAARVQHPNSVAFIDYGVADGLSYIAMELLQGDDLYVLLEREGAVSQLRAARILVEVCDALSVAHELGIVHRDLKPENIMVIADGSHPNGERVKVLDFGIAKLLVPDAPPPTDPRNDARLDPPSGVTRAGTFIGTPSYMSPEQCALQAVDTRADIYTCGVLLFQLVTGRLPFEGQTPLHTATLHIHEVPPRPSTLAPSIDPRLEAVILKALAKKPADRHQTARHLASMLRKILPDLQDAVVATGLPPPGAPRASSRTRGESAPVSSSPDPETPRAAAPGPAGVTGAPAAPPRPAITGGAAAPRPPRPSLQSAPTMGQGPTPLVLQKAPPPRVRPAAGAPPGGVNGTADDAAPSSAAVENDSARTLVRPPLDDDAPRMNRELTEVIPPPDEMSARSAALGAPPAPPPPPPPRAGPPHPAPPHAPSPGAPRPAGAAPTPRPAPRTFKPTLKSAGLVDQAGKPSGEAAQPGKAPPEPRDDAPTPHVPEADVPAAAGESSAVIAAGAVISVRGPGVLGALQLGSAQLGSKPSQADAPEADTPPPPPSIERRAVTTEEAFEETTKMDVADVPSMGGGFVPTAQTVPLIPPDLVAAVIARGPRPAAGAPALPPPGAAPGGMPSPAAPIQAPAPVQPSSQVFAPPSAQGYPQPSGQGYAPPAAQGYPPPGAQAYTPLAAQGYAQQQALAPTALQPVQPGPGPAMPALPPTPPVFPVPEAPEEGGRSSAARGMLLGFVAGAVLMAIVTVVYLLTN
jgi:serine/threonine-protein kinase